MLASRSLFSAIKGIPFPLHLQQGYNNFKVAFSFFLLPLLRLRRSSLLSVATYVFFSRRAILTWAGTASSLRRDRSQTRVSSRAATRAPLPRLSLAWVSPAVCLSCASSRFFAGPGQLFVVRNVSDAACAM